MWSACSQTSLLLPLCGTGTFVLGLGGTSMSAPHVSGLASLVIEDVGRNVAKVRAALEGDVMAPGGGLRGSPAGARRLPGAPRFVAGWVVVRGDSPLFVYRRLGATDSVELGSAAATRVSESGLFRRVELDGTRSGTLYFGLSGPGAESLRAEFVSR